MNKQTSDASAAAGSTLAAGSASSDFRLTAAQMAINNLAVLLKLALEKLDAPADVLGAHEEGDTDAVLTFITHRPKYPYLDASELEDAVSAAARRLTGIGEWNDAAVKTITEEVVSAILRKPNAELSDAPKKEK